MSSPPIQYMKLKIQFPLYPFISRSMFYFRASGCYLKGEPGTRRGRNPGFSEVLPPGDSSLWTLPMTEEGKRTSHGAIPASLLSPFPHSFHLYPLSWLVGGLLGSQSSLSVTKMPTGPLPPRALPRAPSAPLQPLQDVCWPFPPWLRWAHLHESLFPMRDATHRSRVTAPTTNGNSRLEAGKLPYFGARYKESVLALNLLTITPPPAYGTSEAPRTFSACQDWKSWLS